MSPQSKSVTPTASLHTPEELLDGAEILFDSGNPKMMRAAVLEAITALEAYIQDIVFSALNDRIDSSLVQWLEERTRMDFDSRLSVLTPVAIGRPIEKKSQLWDDYKKAKEIRNKVTHSGKKVSDLEARFVIDTVYRWLAYLGSTIELELALIGLKRYVEDNKVSVPNGDAAVKLISEYFGRTKAATTSINAEVEFGRSSRQVDIILKFGAYTVIVETKFFATSSSYQGHLLHSLSVPKQKSDPIEQLVSLMNASGITQGALIIFQQRENQRDIPPEFQTVRKYHDGKVYAVFIRV